MRISAQEEYGLRCLVQLARAGAEPEQGVTLSTRHIAEQEGLTLESAAQILGALRRAGFVKSVRGVRGGFRLARSADRLSVGDLIRAFDGQFAENVCENYTGTRETCINADGCGVAPVWAELSRRMYGFLDDVSIADIVSGSVERTDQVIPLKALTRR